MRKGLFAEPGGAERLGQALADKLELLPHLLPRVGARLLRLLLARDDGRALRIDGRALRILDWLIGHGTFLLQHE
jgi:hypothetical protein